MGVAAAAAAVTRPGGVRRRRDVVRRNAPLLQLMHDGRQQLPAVAPRACGVGEHMHARRRAAVATLAPF